MRRVRAFLVLATFLAFTVPLMPLQLLFVRTGSRFARTFPHWYHRQVCRIVGVRLNVNGQIAESQGVLIVSNHVSWLDITVLSAVAPVSFVAKQEVSTWPFVKWLAKLQRSVFVDRERRTEVGNKANEILNRLEAGDHVVLFAEGTSSDGNTVVPFRTALFAAAKPPGGHPMGSNVSVQTLALSYTKLYGLPLGRRGIRQRDIIERRAEALLSQNADYRRLKTIPGVGPINALTVLAEAGDLRRFRHHRQFLKFCGLDLATHQSGQFRSQTKIAKFGNARLRRTFWMAGQVAVRQRENSFRSKYERYVARDRDNADLKRKALAAIAAKMARVTHAVIVGGEDVSPFFDRAMPGGRTPL